MARDVSFWSGLCIAVRSAIYAQRYGTYSGICYHTRRLDLDQLLQELDAAYSDGDGGAIHAPKNIELDGHHRLPYRRLVGVGRTGAQGQTHSLRQTANEQDMQEHSRTFS